MLTHTSATPGAQQSQPTTDTGCSASPCLYLIFANVPVARYRYEQVNRSILGGKPCTIILLPWLTCAIQFPLTPRRVRQGRHEGVCCCCAWCAKYIAYFGLSGRVMRRPPDSDPFRHCCPRMRQIWISSPGHGPLPLACRRPR